MKSKGKEKEEEIKLMGEEKQSRNEEIFTKLQLTIKWWVNAFTSNVQKDFLSLPFLDYNTA